ncbi:ABC transporter, ATP-binding protein [Marvinbryantia formatexigens DSM 14469]|uniref:ABC transporter, ATP-binding protein n=1 Tax=Marvinbryantia formatexigens DSM 14469 TaxID=478749 RepID=C6LC44_9FIRM|nr:ABC transporter, ATP-binding protein [Marvinbryantia formatexigens DSM 14469]SDF32014.1 putative ABC transport system ATP-binding protein [Marvinbryantia formatexigens]
MMEILRCEGIRKVYGAGENRVVALDGVNLSVERGEFAAIVGASGSGKSTLLHILGSVEQPTQGRVLVEGEDISSMNRTQSAIFRRRKVGLVYQFYNLIPTLTVRQNILMPLLLDKRRPDREYFAQIVDTLGIADRLEFLPGQLSGGQQQRAAIARALIYRPAILLADEPTGNLDRRNSEEIIDMLKRSNRSLDQTILLITHDERIALAADRMITIEDGRIIGDCFCGGAGEDDCFCEGAGEGDCSCGGAGEDDCFYGGAGEDDGFAKYGESRSGKRRQETCGRIIP